MKIKLGDMTINKRKKICLKHPNCAHCPFYGNNSMGFTDCSVRFWQLFPDQEVEVDEEDLK